MTDGLAPTHPDSGQPAESDPAKLREQLAELRKQLDATKQRLEMMEAETLVDPLTGVSNRRAMENDLNRRLSEWHRYGAHFSILLIDFDSLKEVNDHHGHVAGDQLLRQMSQLLSGQLRRCDLFYRLGGDEFVVILPSTHAEPAQAIAQRLCQQAARHVDHTESPVLKTTISVGIAEVEINDTFESILRKADKRMYLAKSRGGNQWCGTAVKSGDSVSEHPPE